MTGEGRPSTKWHPGARVGVRGAVRLSALLQGSVSLGGIAGGQPGPSRSRSVCWHSHVRPGSVKWRRSPPSLPSTHHGDVWPQKALTRSGRFGWSRRPRCWRRRRGNHHMTAPHCFPHGCEALGSPPGPTAWPGEGCYVISPLPGGYIPSQLPSELWGLRGIRPGPIAWTG